MRFVLAVLTAGLAAWGSLLWLTPVPEDRRLAEVSGVSSAGLVRVGSDTAAATATAEASPSIPRFFSSAMPLQIPQQAQLQARTQVLADSSAATASPVAAASPVLAMSASTARLAVTSGWTTDVVPPPVPAKRSGPSSMVVTSVASQVRDIPRGTLVRDLQRELRRVGCYYGEADGDWGTGSRRALQAFLERSNSALPVGEPDLIQLTLVRGYQGIACRSADGAVVAARPERPALDNSRLPAPAIAVRALPAAPTQVTRSPVATAAAQQQASFATVPAVTVQPPFEGRMAVGALPAPAGVEADAAAGAGGLPGVDAAVPAIAPPTRPKSPPRTYRKQTDRSWTSNFFNQ